MRRNEGESLLFPLAEVGSKAYLSLVVVMVRGAAAKSAFCRTNSPIIPFHSPLAASEPYFPSGTVNEGEKPDEM